MTDPISVRLPVSVQAAQQIEIVLREKAHASVKQKTVARDGISDLSAQIQAFDIGNDLFDQRDIHQRLSAEEPDGQGRFNGGQCLLLPEIDQIIDDGLGVFKRQIPGKTFVESGIQLAKHAILAPQVTRIRNLEHQLRQIAQSQFDVCG